MRLYITLFSPGINILFKEKILSKILMSFYPCVNNFNDSALMILLEYP